MGIYHAHHITCLFKCTVQRAYGPRSKVYGGPLEGRYSFKATTALSNKMAKHNGICSSKANPELKESEAGVGKREDWGDKSAPTHRSIAACEAIVGHILPVIIVIRNPQMLSHPSLTVIKPHHPRNKPYSVGYVPVPSHSPSLTFIGHLQAKKPILTQVSRTTTSPS